MSLESQKQLIKMKVNPPVAGLLKMETKQIQPKNTVKPVKTANKNTSRIKPKGCNTCSRRKRRQG